jgi:hypothetical protein
MAYMVMEYPLQSQTFPKGWRWHFSGFVIFQLLLGDYLVSELIVADVVTKRLVTIDLQYYSTTRCRLRRLIACAIW